MTVANLGEPAPRNNTPLFDAQNASRYERQQLIRRYQTKYDCRLIVVSSPIYRDSLVYLEELIHDCDPKADLHLMLTSDGGDGETALRIARSLQTRCRTLTVLLPDRAKSAATLLTIGAHSIHMGPFGDLGPIDPQLALDSQNWVAAKDIIAAVDDATARIQAAPDSYPLWASLFSNLTGLIVQQARTAIDRSSDQLREALAANPDRTPDEVEKLFKTLSDRLITLPKSHSAVFGASDARLAGLPVTELDPTSDRWQEIWRLWSRYAVLGNVAVYEGERASQVLQLSS